MVKQWMTTLALISPCESDQCRRHEAARNACRDRGTTYAKSRKSKLAVDQHPVEKPVDQVRAYVGERDHAHLANSLQIAARGSVEKKRQRAPEQITQITRCWRGHVRSDAEAREGKAGQPQQQHERRRDEASEVDALREPAVA